MYLFWLCWVLVVVRRIFTVASKIFLGVACGLLIVAGMWDLVPRPGIEPRAYCIGSMESYLLDHQGSP